MIEHLETNLAEVLIIQYDGGFDDDTGEYSGVASAKLDNDCTYEGDFLNGLFHGKGKFTWADGVSYEGDFRNNQIIGKGVYTYTDGSVYTGDVLNGKRHGVGKLVNSNGQVYDGEWKLGKRHGLGKMVYGDDKSTTYVGDWVENNREGYGIMRYNSGNSFEGQWFQDKKHGFGVMQWKDIDEIYVGNWFHDKPHGFGEHIWGETTAKALSKQNCNIYRGEYFAGKRQGHGIFFYANGSRYTGFWLDDCKQGPGVLVHPDNRIVVSLYNNNRIAKIFGGDNDYYNNTVATTATTTTTTVVPAATTVLSSKSPRTPTTTSRENKEKDKDQNNGVITSAYSNDIIPQFYLHIIDVLSRYPTNQTGDNDESVDVDDVDINEKLLNERRKTIIEIQRLLLKYNTYIKSAYKRYADFANRQRTREHTYVPNKEFYQGITLNDFLATCTNNNKISSTTDNTDPAVPIMNSERLWKLHKASIHARNISKRFNCCSIEQFARFLRELNMINCHFNVYDIKRIYKQMQSNYLLITKQLFITGFSKHQEKHQQLELQNLLKEREETLKKIDDLRDSMSSNTTGVINRRASTRIVTSRNSNRPNSGPNASKSAKNKEAEKATENATKMAELNTTLIAIKENINELENTMNDPAAQLKLLKTTIVDANLTLSGLLPKFMHHYFADDYFDIMDNQPLLEHEFVELFVRCVAEIQARRGFPKNTYLSLYDVIGKVLHQQVIPSLSSMENIPEFYRLFYDEHVQDIFKHRVSTNTYKHHHSSSNVHIGSNLNIGIFEEIWLTLRNISITVINTSNKTNYKENTSPRTGYIKMKVFIDWLLTSQRKFIQTSTESDGLMTTNDDEIIKKLLEAMELVPPPKNFQESTPTDDEAEEQTFMDYSGIQRDICFEDFIEYFSRFVISDLFNTSVTMNHSADMYDNANEVTIPTHPMHSPSKLALGNISVETSLEESLLLSRLRLWIDHHEVRREPI